MPHLLAAVQLWASANPRIFWMGIPGIPLGKAFGKFHGFEYFLWNLHFEKQPFTCVLHDVW